MNLARRRWRNCDVALFAPFAYLGKVRSSLSNRRSSSKAFNHRMSMQPQAIPEEFTPSMTIPKFKSLIAAFVVLLAGSWSSLTADEQATLRAFLWPSEPPQDCPFEQSKELVGILFTGVHSDYEVADTWYPSWASDGNLYSPWTDGWAPRLDGGREWSASYGYLGHGDQ